MNRFPAVLRTVALLGAAVGAAACQAQPGEALARDGRSAAAQQPGGLDAADAFHNWAYALPERTELPPMTGSMSFTMRGDVAGLGGGSYGAMDLPPGADTAIAMDFAGELQLDSWTRMRMQMDLRMEIGPLKAQDARPLEIGLLIVADGETVWIEPDWSRAWFLDELEGQATGFERLVFSVKTATVREFLDAAASTLEGEAADWYRSSIECAANPACLARLLADRVGVESFAQDGERVSADLVLDMKDWLPPELVEEQPGALSPFAMPLRYRCEFDASTGTIIRTSFAMTLDGALEVSMVQQMRPAAQAFAADDFRYELPPDRQAFPLDLFVRPILAGIRRDAGQPLPDPTAGDLPF